MLWRELERLRLQLQESRAERCLPAGGKMREGSVRLRILIKNKVPSRSQFLQECGAACCA